MLLFIRMYKSVGSLPKIPSQHFSPPTHSMRLIFIVEMQNGHLGQYWNNASNIKRETTRQLKSLTFNDSKGYFEQWKWK